LLLHGKLSPVLIILLLAAIILALVAVPDSVVGLFFAISGGLWGSLTLLASDMIEKRIGANIEEMEKRGKKVGRIRKRRANWPTISLRIASRLWGLGALFFGIELVVDVLAPGLPSPSQDDALFIFGIVTCGLAGIETANVFEFISNRKFKPFVSALKAAKSGLVLGALYMDFVYALYALLVITKFSAAPFWIQAFGIDCVIGVVGSSLLIFKFLKVESDRLYLLGLAVFSSPFFLLIVFGVLMRLGVSL
jgi:hypothetical protein